MKKKTIGALIVPALALVLAGCGKSPVQTMQEEAGEKMAEKYLENNGAEDVDVDVDNGEVNLKTDEAEVNISDKGEVKLPDDFPSDIFVYSDARITYAASNTSGTNLISVVYFTDASIDDAFATYKTKMQENGWEKTSELSMGAEQGNMLYFDKEKRTLGITIQKEASDPNNNGKTRITLSQTVLEE